MVYRIYVEKKPGFDGEAQSLRNELVSLLGIKELNGLRLLNRYEVEGIDEALFEQCVPTVFSEPPVDNTYAELPVSDGAAACVILASGGYPVAYEKGKPITGLVDGQLPDEPDVTVYHSGTAIAENGQLVTNGGRVLGVTATAPGLPRAIAIAYEAAEHIHFDKLHKRADIGMRALKALAEKQ